MNIFVDIDGVLADFVGAALALHKADNPWNNGNNLGKYELPELIGMSANKFWEPTNTHEFWESLTPLPEGIAMLKFLEHDFPRDKIYLATSPTLSPHCSAGKHAWIAKHLPNYTRKSFIGASKEVFGMIPSSILIDDCETNIDKFIQVGGRGLLWPQPWNRGHIFKETKEDYFAQGIVALRNHASL